MWPPPKLYCCKTKVQPSRVQGWIGSPPKKIHFQGSSQSISTYFSTRQFSTAQWLLLWISTSLTYFPLPLSHILIFEWIGNPNWWRCQKTFWRIGTEANRRAQEKSIPFFFKLYQYLSWSLQSNLFRIKSVTLVPPPNTQKIRIRSLPPLQPKYYIKLQLNLLSSPFFICMLV